MLHCVITTIQEPTVSVRKLAGRLAGDCGQLVVAGDTKGPAEFKVADIEDFSDDQLTFLSIEDQLDSEFELARLLPTKHYARKNIGYLQAIRAGATCIYETDDDNAPLDSWEPRSEFLSDVDSVASASDQSPYWVNVYRHFSDQNIWPRGLPLDQIHTPLREADSAGVEKTEFGYWAPIQQGLADGSPDVDAIWRLVLDREFSFDQNGSVLLPPGQWCPFNTQTTWWWPAVYPLLYVPSYCSFRMCDIWKSFVAQRCLWELGTGVVFHAAEVWQERNVHNLLRDFDDEVPGYQQNNRIAEILQSVELAHGPEFTSSNLRCCYQALIEAEVFPEREQALVNAWTSDLSSISSGL